MKPKKIFIAVIIFLTLIFISNVSTAMTSYATVDTTTGIVTAGALNVRQGPGINYKVNTIIYKNEYVRIFAKIGNWYVIQTNGDFIGMASSQYIKLVYDNNSDVQSSDSDTTTDDSYLTSAITQDEQEVFDLINEQRTAAGLAALQWNDDVQNIARIKAQDMVKNGYFSHTSPTYGTPFEMMKNFGITYKAAGENIAGNSTNQGAVTAWMNSAGHKANILSNNYNYTGIGVVKSSTYGKVYVQMFIGK